MSPIKEAAWTVIITLLMLAVLCAAVYCIVRPSVPTCEDTVKIQDIAMNFQYNEFPQKLRDLHKSIPEKPCDANHHVHLSEQGNGGDFSITTICECKSRWELER